MTQHVDAHAASNNQGVGIQINFSSDPGDEIIDRLRPEIERLLARLSEAIALIHEIADSARVQIPPGLDPSEALKRMAELYAPREQLPLLLQVSEIARSRAPDPIIREALDMIAERWASGAIDGQNRLRTFREYAQSEEQLDEHSCFLIVLNKDRNGSSGYWLSLILFRNGRDAEPQPEGGECLSLPGIRSRLRDVLPTLVQTVDRRTLILEFAVPRDLLNLDFDQWLIPERADEPTAKNYRLGSRYAVVVRDLQRMVPSDDRSLWRARWQRLRECAGPGHDAIRWVAPEGRDSCDSLTASLLREHSHGQVCLALLAASAFGTSIIDLLDAGITAGVPAAIWLREPFAGGNAGEKNLDDLTQAVASAELRRLPRTVLDLRLEAEEEHQKTIHPGRNLSLLWDDPGRTWWRPTLAEPALSANGTVE